MLLLGEMNRLKVLKEVDFGLYLDGEIDEILIPKRYVPEGTKVGDSLDIFLYRDSEDRLIATTEMPKIMVGEFAYLEVVDTNKYGVFLDWGMPKDLIVPFQEQNGKMQVGKYYVVYAYIDQETNRIVASARIEHFLNDDISSLYQGEEVKIVPFKYTDLGIKVIVNGKFEGLLYKNEVFGALQFGKETTAFINKIRDNGKLDIRMKKTGYQAPENNPNQSKIMNILSSNNGFLPYHDKSDPEAIYAFFAMSKRDFKQSIGGLFKENRIKIQPNGIQIV